MPINAKADQEFFGFISKELVKKEKDEKGRTVSKESSLENLELILNLETNYPGMFIKIMTNFENAKSYRTSLDETGRPVTIPWEEALKKFYTNIKYAGITNENKDIAELFAGKGLSQEIFDRATNLRQEAKAKGIEEHILGKSIKEETILESIERIKNQTEQELLNAKDVIEELYEKQFTYEWLSKNDPHNSIMGLFCSCCGSITSRAYGKDIAKASVLEDNVQNLVVRNSKGEIISKGTMYVNKKNGYGVINDFELNQKYRNHEKKLPGRYNVNKNSKEEQERELIFKSFLRGLKAFVQEYNAQNPKAPMKQINIGMGYNRLKRQVEQFEKATSKLTVPPEYKFQDAMTNDQYILYKREEKKLERGGNEK